MIKVTDIAQQILETDNIALESFKLGLLNLTAYANKILPQVEELTKKPVKKGTIVVALSRLAPKIGQSTYGAKNIRISDLSVKSSLCLLTFEKTADIQRRIAVLHPFQITTSDIFAVVQGQSEVTLVITQKSLVKIEKQLGVKPLTKIEDVVAVTVGFAKETENSSTGNIFHSLLSTKRVKVLQTITTFSEVTFIVDRVDLEKAVNILNFYFKDLGV